MSIFQKINTVLCWLVLSVPLPAQDSTRSTLLSDDPLLDQLIGDWEVERTFGSGGRTAKNLVHAEWVLQHQFVELHYRDAAASPRYEAIVLIGYDAVGKRYLCHWADNYGATYSADGFALREEAANAMEFKFEFRDGQLTNRFAFDAASGSWTSTIRQAEKGEWQLFCEDKFTRSAAKP